MSTPLIELFNLSCGYANREVFTDLTLTLARSQSLGLAGHTGSGKTTLLKAIMGLVKPRAGTIRIDGRDCCEQRSFSHARKLIGYLFQNPDDQLFCPTLLEDVAFGPLNLGATPAEARSTAEACLNLVGLSGFEDRLTHCLSGGEKRLASLAGVLAMRPQALLLDEPTTGLDPESINRVAEVLRSLDLAMLVVSHEWDFLTRVADTHYVLSHGHLHRASPAPHTHRHAHTLGEFPHSHD